MRLRRTGLRLSRGRHRRAAHAHFGRDEWARFAAALKNLDDALLIRRRVPLSFEQAEIENDPARRQAWIIWLLAHIYFLIGFCNRLAVVLDWAWAYWTPQRQARIVKATDDDTDSPD